MLLFEGAESMVMKFHANVRGEVRVNFLTLFASKPHIFMCGALKLSGIVRADVRLNIAIPMLFSEDFSLLVAFLLVTFSWLFRGPLLSRKKVLGPFSWLFRGPLFLKKGLFSRGFFERGKRPIKAFGETAH